jgi:SlyX protein
MKTEQDRLTDLEIRYTHQAETLHDLHEVVWAQERRIAALEGQVSKLLAYIRESAGAGSNEPLPHERPPHY